MSNNINNNSSYVIRLDIYLSFGIGMLKLDNIILEKWVSHSIFYYWNEKYHFNNNISIFKDCHPYFILELFYVCIVKFVFNLDVECVVDPHSIFCLINRAWYEISLLDAINIMWKHERLFNLIFIAFIFYIISILYIIYKIRSVRDSDKFSVLRFIGILFSYIDITQYLISMKLHKYLLKKEMLEFISKFNHGERLIRHGIYMEPFNIIKFMLSVLDVLLWNIRDWNIYIISAIINSSYFFIGFRYLSAIVILLTTPIIPQVYICSPESILINSLWILIPSMKLYLYYKTFTVLVKFLYKNFTSNFLKDNYLKYLCFIETILGITLFSLYTCFILYKTYFTLIIFKVDPNTLSESIYVIFNITGQLTGVTGIFVVYFVIIIVITSSILLYIRYNKIQ